MTASEARRSQADLRRRARTAARRHDGAAAAVPTEHRRAQRNSSRRKRGCAAMSRATSSAAGGRCSPISSTCWTTSIARSARRATAWRRQAPTSLAARGVELVRDQFLAKLEAVRRHAGRRARPAVRRRPRTRRCRRRRSPTPRRTAASSPSSRRLHDRRRIAAAGISRRGRADSMAEPPISSNAVSATSSARSR